MPLIAVAAAIALSAGMSASAAHQERKQQKSIQAGLDALNQQNAQGELTQEVMDDLSRKRMLRRSIYLSQNTPILGNVGRTMLS